MQTIHLNKNTRLVALVSLTSDMGVGFTQSAQRLATGCTVRESNPDGGENFPIRPDRPWGPPSLLYNECRVFPGGVKRPGRGVDHPPPSSAEVEERVELNFISPFGPSWYVLG